MNNKKINLFNLIDKLHNSEKSSFQIEKNNTYVFKVNKNANKKNIKMAIQKIFGIEVTKIKTLIIKGKKKRTKQNLGYRKDWKKAYISIKKGSELKLIKEK